MQMGMDIYGKSPTSEVGEYFRANVWGWHPIATYIENEYPEIAVECASWHTNDGQGLNAESAQRLGNRLLDDARSGSMLAYKSRLDREIAALPRETCTLCNGTGVRTDAVGVQMGMPERNYCNGCSGEGTREPFAASYTFRVERVVEFANFAIASGGFQIW